MSIFGLILASLVLIVIVVVLRENARWLGVLASVAAGVVLLLAIIPQIRLVVNLLDDLALRSSVDVRYLGLILKVIGIAYLAEFAAEVARDAGEGALAHKVELAGKVTILALSVPVVLAVLEIVLKLLQA